MRFDPKPVFVRGYGLIFLTAGLVLAAWSLMCWRGWAGCKAGGHNGECDLILLLSLGCAVPAVLLVLLSILILRGKGRAGILFILGLLIVLSALLRYANFYNDLYQVLIVLFLGYNFYHFWRKP